MNILPRYETLSMSDVREFEKILISWSKNNNESGVLIFDESSFEKIFNSLRNSRNLNGLIFVKSSTNTKKMDTEKLAIEWSSVDGEKSILLSITSKETGKILYQSPHKWEGCKIFYGF